MYSCSSISQYPTAEVLVFCCGVKYSLTCVLHRLSLEFRSIIFFVLPQTLLFEKECAVLQQSLQSCADFVLPHSARCVPARCQHTCKAICQRLCFQLLRHLIVHACREKGGSKGAGMQGTLTIWLQNVTTQGLTTLILLGVGWHTWTRDQRSHRS